MLNVDPDEPLVDAATIGREYGRQAERAVLAEVSDMCRRFPVYR